MDAMDKWKKSVIHLECAADSKSLTAQSLSELMAKRKRGEITTDEEIAQRLLKGSRDLRHQGTAIFFKHQGRRYLLTARHMVYDKLAAERELKEQKERLGSSVAQDMILLRSAGETAANRIFSIIFRVPSLEEFSANRQAFVPQFLMNLGAGTSWSVPYTFSREELDLAIISLDQRNSKFADELLSLGYIPISMQDLSDEPSAEGVDVFTIGYPNATAVIGQRRLTAGERNWASSDFSVPVFSFGRVSMLQAKLEFFWCDMSIFPGNSGGPVVEYEKLVGIVSAQPLIQSHICAPSGEQLPEVAFTRIPFGRMIKGKFIKELLEAQIRKDSQS